MAAGMLFAGASALNWGVAAWGVTVLQRAWGGLGWGASALVLPRPWGVDELIEVISLSELANARLMTLSGGQRRRLDVAIAIVGRPEVVFLDEPTAGFDPHARREFHNLMHELSDLENMTILITAHDLDEAEKVADRIIVLDEGRIVGDGTVEQLARQFAVLGIWAVIGMALAPLVLRRMARRQSGAAVAAARERIMSKGY